MKKKIIIAASIFIIIAGILVNALYINIHQLNVREEVLQDAKLDEDFDGFVIAYFADTHYGYTDTEVIKEAIERINSFAPDIIIFGGDLVDTGDGIDKEELTAIFSELNAKYAKYYVLGNHDLSTSNTESLVKEVLNASGFTDITNTSVQFYLDKDSFMNIVGVDSSYGGDPDLEMAYSRVNASGYTLAVCHTPDIFASLPADKTDYVLSGHSHGGQVYIPLVSYFTRPQGCKTYFRGKTTENGMTLDITNGVGITHKKARLLADSEIVIYKINGN